MNVPDAMQSRHWRIAPDVLARRADVAQAMPAACEMCELRCGANRLTGRTGPCRLGVESHIYKQYVSSNEEGELLPAWRVFLGGCNFRCPYCDEAPEAFDAEAGDVVEPRRWADELARVIRRGAKTVSVLGGEPSLHAHSILATAAASEDAIPLALNSNMYMTPKVLDLLDGVVRWYLADFKFGNDECAERLAGVPRYSEIVRRNLAYVFGRTGLIVRHVLLPGHMDCCFRKVADWVAANLPGVRFELYPGYVPCGEARGDETIGRFNTPEEIRFAQEYACKLGLACAAAAREEARVSPSAECNGRGLAGITIGADGRLYCHDIASEMSSILSAMCGEQAFERERTYLAKNHEGDANAHQ